MPETASGEELTMWQGALRRVLSRVDTTIRMDLEGFPHHGDPATGTWTTTPDGFWTGGFWVGELWLSAALAQDPSYLVEARKWLSRLERRVESRTVFRGFLFYYCAVVGAQLHRDAEAGRIAALASTSLAGCFDPVAGLIPLGAEAEEAHTVGDCEANIDGLPAAALMLWAARHLGDDKLRRTALDHAYGSYGFFVRPDGGTIQSASFDGATGEVVRRYTHKGYSDSSIWTRAQAWAMLGYTLAARLEPGETRLLEHAGKVSDWWVERLPEDGVAYWDFDAPVNAETRKDTSGTAIGAAALLKLAAIHPDAEKAARYAATARASLKALVERHLREDGILAEGCFDPKNGVAVANELVWGDYFLLESLGVLTGRLDPAI